MKTHRTPSVALLALFVLTGCVAPFVTYPEMFYTVNSSSKQQSVFREGETWGIYINGYVGNLTIEVRYEDTNEYLANYYDNKTVLAKDSKYLPYGKSVISLAESYATCLDGTILPYCRGKYSVTLLNGLTPVNKLFFTVVPGDPSTAAVIRDHMNRNSAGPLAPMTAPPPSSSHDPLGIL